MPNEEFLLPGDALWLEFVNTALEAVAESAARSLSDPVAVIRRRGTPGRGLYFVDDTPAQSRRWCGRGRRGRSGGIERRRSTPRLTPMLPEG